MQAEQSHTEPAPAAGEGMHNSVLIRTHEPRQADHGRLYTMLLGVGIVVAAAVWIVVEIQPHQTIVNHAVAAAPATTSQAGG